MSTDSFGLGYLLGMTGVVAFGAVIPIVPTGAAVSVGAAVAERDHVLLLILVVVFGAAGAYLGDVITYAALRVAARQVESRRLAANPDGSHGLAPQLDGPHRLAPQPDGSHGLAPQPGGSPRNASPPSSAAPGAARGDAPTALAGSLPRWLPRWLGPTQRAETLARFREQLAHHELRTLLLSRLVPGGRIPVLLAAALDGYSWQRFAIADLGAASLWSLVYSGIGLIGRAVFPEPWQAAVAAIVLVLLVSAVSSRLRQRLELRRQPASRE